MEEVTIGKVCNQISVGHIRQMKLIATSDFLSFQEPIGALKMPFENMALKVDAKIYSSDFFRKEAKFSEKQMTGSAGFEYEFDLDWIWNYTTDLSEFLFQNQNKRWILFFADQNGQAYVAGSLEQPARLSFSRAIDNSNFLKLNLSAKLWHPVFLLTSLNILEMLETKVIDLRKYASIDIKVVEGDTINEPLTFRDANGDIENLTGSTFKMQVRRPDGSIVTSFVMGTGFSLQNGNTELLMFKSEVIPAGDYVYDIQRTNSDTTVDTIMKGKFIVEPQITT